MLNGFKNQHNTTNHQTTKIAEVNQIHLFTIR